MNQHKKHTSIAAVVCAIVCPSARIGLFIRQPDKQYPMWKMASGGIEPGESTPQGLLREVEEETGFVIPSYRDKDGSLVVGNDDCRVVSFGCEPTNGPHGVHDKHFFAVIVKDPREIIALDRQQLKEDEDELIETRVFRLDEIAAIPDFLYRQRPFLTKVIEYALAEQ